MRGNSKPVGPRRHRAFSLIEVLVCGCVLAVLFVMIAPAVMWVLRAGMAAKSSGTLRQLVVANQCYAADHDGFYCPAQEPLNLIRWHGGRDSISGPFDP